MTGYQESHEGKNDAADAGQFKKAFLRNETRDYEKAQQIAEKHSCEGEGRAKSRLPQGKTSSRPSYNFSRMLVFWVFLRPGPYIFREWDLTGPINLIQVENEYASFGNDPTYMAWISEAYPRWLTPWGENDLAHVEFTKDFSAIVAKGLSFNLYIVHGGTNFGFGEGANADRDGSGFEPVITSYDYDAPIDEAGCPAKKYYAFPNLLVSAGICKDLTVSALPPMTEFQPVKAYRIGFLWEGPGAVIVCGNTVSIKKFIHQR
ncbi:MAG: beta-galactosidase [Gluconobacter cerinus]|uniref:beta-galactosidase n=1 Tax=Gluconobacter cerinus TaxID=38307 RepID=UPI0039E82D04